MSKMKALLSSLCDIICIAKELFPCCKRCSHQSNVNLCFHSISLLNIQGFLPTYGTLICLSRESVFLLFQQPFSLGQFQDLERHWTIQDILHEGFASQCHEPCRKYLGTRVCETRITNSRRRNSTLRAAFLFYKSRWVCTDSAAPEAFMHFMKDLSFSEAAWNIWF